MKKLLYIIGFALILGNATSCKTDFLDLEPLDQFAEGTVWNDPALIETFVNNIYYSIPHGFHAVMLSSASDESMAVWDWESSNITKSQIIPSYLALWDENFWTGRNYQGRTWTNAYRAIRACNIFLDKIESAPFTDENQKKNLTGQVHFLRAHLYQNLVSLYGGVPLITRPYDLNDDFMASRDTYENCIKFISEECDKAAALLPLVQGGSSRGRATKGAALALKSRALLYAASDLFNTTSWAGGFAKPELISNVGGSRQDRYQAAKAAAKAVIDLGVYSLFRANPAPTDSAAKNYSDLFLQKETNEDIFVQFFLQRANQGWDIGNPGLYNGPNGYHNWGGNTPLGQVVDAYEMKDGTKFNWDNPTHKANPYKNRDPRFYASILYEGSHWRKRPADVIGQDPLGIVQVGFYERPGGVLAPGLDTRKSPIEDWNGTYTGYYLRKFIDPTVDHQYFRQEVPWRYMRYAEVLLNYAEACLGLEQYDEARQYINMVRARAGMPLVTENGQALVERYRNERQVELAFEDHRYFDVRRWMIAPQVYSNARGVDVRYKLNPDNTTSAKPTFSVIEVQNRAWNDRSYLLPIKLDEMNRNNQLAQNPLY
jgi:starch-binding outer membrane protein, SusD/RagB family